MKTLSGTWAGLAVILCCLSVSACLPPIGEATRTFYPAYRLTFIGGKKPVPIVAKGAHVEGADCKNFLLSIIPTSSGDPMGKISEAVKDALKEKEEDVLVDGTVSEYFWVVPGIWAQHCYKVEGHVARSAFGVDLVR